MWRNWISFLYKICFRSVEQTIYFQSMQALTLIFDCIRVLQHEAYDF